VTADALALAAVLAQPWADVVLGGASTRAMLQSNLAAAQVEVEFDRLDSLREPAEGYWAKRSELPWN
jgi:aryl-alcohol dehydrogenase-like predicted oxidoreductase